MADVKFLANLDVDGNISLTAGSGYQIKNASFESLTADPTSNNFEGRMIYRSDTNQVRFYNGSAWTSIAGDITGVTAGTGLTGGGTSGAVTLNVVGGDGITANANEIEVAVDGSTITLSASDGTGQVQAATGDIEDGGQHLATSGTIFSYIDSAGFTTNTGTVTSVGLTAGAGVTITGSTITSSGSFTVGVDGVLQDLDTLGAPTADGQFIVATGAGVFAYESGSTARTSLGLGSLATLNAVGASQITDNSVGADELNVSGDGTSGYVLTSDGDGSFSWSAKTTNTDTDVSVSNLESRLAEIDSNITVGNSSSVQVSTAGKLVVGGDLVVNGTTTTVNSTTVAIDDHHFKVATDNNGSTNDFGYYGRYGSTAEYAGLTFDVSAEEWTLYHSNATEPGNTTFAPSTKASLNIDTLKAVGLDISGNADIDGTLETDALSINGTTITATATELNYVDGVTSAIQTQINGKQATITGGATTITSSNLTASRALVSNSSGKVAVSAVTSTELGYLDGVTSAIQTQINGKQATLTAGNGIDISSNTISVDLTGSDSIGQLATDGSGTAIEGNDFLLAVRASGDVQRVSVDDLGVSTSNASFTGRGIVELATVNETLTGTDGTRAVTPQGLAGTKYIATIGDGTATSYTVTHSLGSRRVMVQLYDSSSYEQVYAQVVRTTSSAITVDFNTAPSTNDITVLVELIN